MTLPQLTQRIDDLFLTTWYSIQPQAIDQITTANVLWAALSAKGCMKPITGGTMITRTIKYGEWAAEDVDKNSTLTSDDHDLETMAWWGFRYFGTGVSRDAFKDIENSGKDKIKDLVTEKLDAARQAMVKKGNSNLLNTFISDESGKAWQGLHDVLPAYADRATGTYGHIARSNTWWQNKYKQWTANREVNLISDMKNFYNTVSNQEENPNLIITDQTTFELYGDYALDLSQLVKVGSGPLVDLGFTVYKFNGCDMIWVPSTNAGWTAGDMMMLNTDYIEVIYDPGMWFSMTEWKPETNTTKRVSHMLSRGNVIGTQPRRQGLLYL